MDNFKWDIIWLRIMQWGVSHSEFTHSSSFACESYFVILEENKAFKKINCSEIEKFESYLMIVVGHS